MAPPRENRFANLSPQKTSTPVRTGTNFAMAQGKGSMPTKEATRRVFFNNRPDISDDRLERRQKQYDELQAFKQSEIEKGNYVKDSKGNPVRDSKGDYVYTNTYTFDTDSSSPTFGQQVGYSVTDKMQDLALKYGPTFREMGSDVGYAMGSMAKGAGDAIMSGNIGIIGAIKGVYNYAVDKASEGYNKLSDVKKEVFENPNKYPYTSFDPEIQNVNQSRLLALESEKDSLGLELDFLKSPGSGYQAGAEQEAFLRSPGTGYQAGTGLRSLPEPKISLEDDNYVESGQFREDLQKSGILSVDDPSTQEPLSDSTKIPGQNSTIGDFKKALKDQGFDDLQIQSAVNQVTQQILSGDFTGDVEFETGSTTRGSELQPNLAGGGEEEFRIEPIDQPIDMTGSVGDRVFLGQNLEKTPSLVGTQYGFKSLKFGDIFEPKSSEENQASVTEYNNPGNLTDVGQAGTTGETYGNNFAVFPNAQAGISALENDLALKVGRSNKVEDIIGQYASGDPNVGNYIDFVTSKVGPTVDQNELNDLRDAVIRFENKPDIAQQYLAMVAEGGLMDKKMYGGIISSKS